MKIELEALKNLFKKPFTKKYPKEKVTPFPRFSGRLHFYPKKCIGCRLCEKYCPVNAIKFHKKGKIDFDMGLCIFCKLCEDICPTKAIKLSNEFEYADKSKKKVSKNVIVGKNEK